MQEEWKDIKNYEGLYQVSNLGDVKSNGRTYIDSSGRNQAKRPRMLKQFIDTKGYYNVKLCNFNEKTQKTHLLVWDTFGNSERNGSILMVDHIDENKRNNRIDNLQLLSNRENVSKSIQKYKKLPIGVTKVGRRYRSLITKKKKSIHLGYFDTIKEAHQAYLQKLSEFENAYST